MMAHQPPGRPPLEIEACQGCKKPFSLLVWKHHCRRCGKQFCAECTSVQVPVPPRFPQPVRVCRPCYDLLASQHHSTHVAPRPPLRASSSLSAKPQQAFSGSAQTSQRDLNILCAAYDSIERDVLATVLQSLKGDVAEAIRYLNGQKPRRSTTTTASSSSCSSSSSSSSSSSWRASSASSSSSSSSARSFLAGLFGSDEKKQAPALPSVGVLSRPQKQLFYQNGFLVVRQAVPRRRVESALRAINVSLGKGINSANHHMGEVFGFRKKQFCPDIRGKPVITDLLRKTAAWDAVESLLGKGNVHVPHGAQIALVFPEEDKLTNPMAHPRMWFNRHVIGAKKAWHIDGVTTPFAKVNRVHNFSLLCGIYLNDVDAEFCGNFTAFPGAHFLMQDHVQQQGVDALVQSGVPSLSLPEPQQLLVKSGDILLAAYHLPHTVAPNISPDVRYAIYFRLFAKSHQPWQYRAEAMHHMWVDYKGLWPVVEELEGKQPYMFS